MLDNLRNFGRSWVAKILLGVLILSVAGFGIPSVFLDLNANTVARVGDENITVREFDRLYRSQMNQYAAQTGTSPTAQQAMSLGIPGAVIGQLASQASVELLAQDLGLGASEEKVASLVRRDPSFAGALGSFDRSEFTAVLRQAGYSESEYLNLQRKAAKREQIGLIFDGLTLPDIALDIANAYDNDRRTVEFVELNPILFSVSEEPTEEQLAQFFEENQVRFRTEETRTVRLLPLTAQALAENMDVSDEQIAAEYERTAAQYTSEERRTIQQVLLADDETRAIFEAGQEAGTPFADLVAEAGLEGQVSELGTLARGQMTDTSLANTAFELEEGSFAITTGAVGSRAVFVSAVEEAGQQPLEEVRDDIAASLRLSLAQSQLATAYDDIDEARAALVPVDDVAAQYGLEIYELDLTRSGEALEAAMSIPPDTWQTVITQVFAASPDAAILPAINLGANRTVFFELVDVAPARDRTLDEARDEAVAAWQELQTDLNMTQIAESMVAALDGGSDMFTVAAEAGQIPQASQPFGRQGADDGSISPDVASAAFQGGEGHSGYAMTQDGDVVVFQVTEVLPATEEAPSPIADALSTGFADLLYASFVDSLRQDHGIRINEDALNRVIGLE